MSNLKKTSELAGMDLFMREMADVVPLKKQAEVILDRPHEVTPGQQYRKERAVVEDESGRVPLSLVLRKKLNPGDWLSYKRNGIQEGVFKNLRLGKYVLEATLNLNKKTPEQARNELIEFVDDCLSNDIRSVLIFFGHGQNGLTLASYLAQWLPELDNVQAFHTAQKHHSGRASLYVLLRKSEHKRQQNRERHAARLGRDL
jgi:DNA-nicking Smr family endonuclease